MTPCSPMMIVAGAAVRARHLLRQKLTERLLRNGWANAVASFV